MINVIEMIQREMKNRHINAADISKKLNLHYSSVAGMLSRPTLQVQRLIELSDVFKYNFFREIAEKLPYEEPLVETEKKYQEEIEKYKEKIKALEMETGILRNTLRNLIAPHRKDKDDN